MLQHPHDKRPFAAVAMDIHPHTDSRRAQEEYGVTLQKNPAGQGERLPQTEIDTISILLVDDHALMREGLRQLLSWKPICAWSMRL